MSVIHTPRKPVLDVRVLVFPFAIFSLLTVLFLRLWFFQVVKADELVEKAQMFNATDLKRLAPRGLIFDRKGDLVAGIRPQLVITGVPAKILPMRKGKQTVDNLWVLDKVAAMIPGADRAKLKEKLDAGSWRPWLPTTIYIGAPMEAAARIAEAGEDELPGIAVDSQPMRYYPDSLAFSHLLGYVWVPSKQDVERLADKNLRPADYVGKGGLEYAYEMQLMGTPGADRMEVDSKRRPIRVMGRDAAIPGDQLILSIDKGAQHAAMEALEAGGYDGAVVAIDPSNGEILCLVSSPSFDTKLFERGISKTDWDMLTNNPHKPLMNRALQSAFAPGSTFKIITSLAAMEAGTFNPNRYVTCAGGYRLGNKFFKCLSRHGTISFKQAMTHSCNTYFMTLGRELGPERLVKAALEAGIGHKTGIELRGESPGVLLTENRLKRYRKPPKYMPSDGLLTSIGQGELACTPMQMAQFAALVGNNGTNYIPHLVRAVRHAGGSTQAEPVPPQIAHHIDAPEAFWSTLKDALVSVIEQGTATGARIQGITWGGKTGSAEQKKGDLTHAWFVGFAPYDHPKIAICVFLERAGHGGTVAAPIAKAVVERYLMGPPKEPKAATSPEPIVSATRALSSKPKDR